MYIKMDPRLTTPQELVHTAYVGGSLSGNKARRVARRRRQPTAMTGDGLEAALPYLSKFAVQAAVNASLPMIDALSHLPEVPSEQRAEYMRQSVDRIMTPSNLLYRPLAAGAKMAAGDASSKVVGKMGRALGAAGRWLNPSFSGVFDGAF